MRERRLGALIALAGLAMLAAQGKAQAQPSLPQPPPFAPSAQNESPPRIPLPGEPQTSPIAGALKLQRVQPLGTSPGPIGLPGSHVQASGDGTPKAFRLLHPGQTNATRRIESPLPPVVKSPQPDSASAQTPSLRLDRAPPAAIQPGMPFTYEFTVRNVGTVAAARAMLEEELPPGTRILGCHPQAQLNGTRLLWVLEPLEPNAVRQFRVQAETTSAAPWEARATLTVAVSSAVTVQPVRPAPVVQPTLPSIELTVGGPPSASTGSPVVLAIQMTNRGNAPTEELTIRCLLSDGLDHEEGKDIEARLDSIRPGENKKLLLDTVAVQPGRQGCRVLLSAGGKQVATASAEVLVTEPVLNLRQTGPLQPWVERENDYRLDVANRHAGELHQVEVMQQLPPGLEFVRAGEGGKYDPASRTVYWQVGTLPGQQTRTLTLRLVARQPGELVSYLYARCAEGHEVRYGATLRAMPQQAGGLASGNPAPGKY